LTGAEGGMDEMGNNNGG